MKDDKKFSFWCDKRFSFWELVVMNLVVVNLGNLLEPFLMRIREFVESLF